MIVSLDVSRNVETKRLKGLRPLASNFPGVLSCDDSVVAEVACDDDIGEGVEAEGAMEEEEEAASDGGGIGPGSTSVTA